MSSEVLNFYKNKNVFITGGTGFLGLAIIEKLLRTCNEVNKIYLLLRPKKGKSIEQRIEEITKNEIFEKMLQNNSSDIFNKLQAVAGDVGQPELGLSSSDRQLLANNVNIVIHSAATLDFQEPLKPTVSINLLGTRRVLELCSEIKKLDAMVHISSAYVNSFLEKTEEVLYPLSEDPEKVIQLAETLTDDVLDELTPKLLKDHPNTYTFTKHMAEHEVNKYVKKFPCGIVRPSMITGAWEEPVPGWTISKNGPQGFIMGAAKGVIRRLPLSLDLINDYIPVDVVVNQILITAYHVNKIKNNDLTIFHCTSSTTNPFKWSLVNDRVNMYLHRYPLNSAVWYPHLKFVPTVWLFQFASIFVHFLPGYFLDFITRCIGGRPILVKLHTNVWNSINLLKKFIFSEWLFDNTNTKKLIETLSDEDKKLFNIDIKTLFWDQYFITLTWGVRRYLNKEPEKTLAAARKKDKILMYVHYVFQVAFHCLIWYLVSVMTGLPMFKIMYVFPISFFLFSLL